MTVALSGFFLLLATVTVALNWIYAGQTMVRRLRGDRRSVSLIHAVPQLLVWAAAVLNYRADPPTFPGWLLLTIALSDPSIYSILFALLSAPIRRFRAGKNDRARLD